MNKCILVTGGAGFIGTNLAMYFLQKGHEVVIFDNFSRKGTESNARMLRSKFGKKVSIVRGDVRTDRKKLETAMKDVSAVIHLAAQVAVTTSVVDPREDFEINALGTFNVLEAIRNSKNKPALIYSSTNKVYGGLDYLTGKSGKERYTLDNKTYNTYGIPESIQLDFHSPYGCSKGSADSYVIDYARVYGLETVVFRQSCIYGPNQFGIEDQGWVAWFVIAAILGKKIKIYGDGKQVRDVLHVTDVARLYESALSNMEKVSGKAYNIGGGPSNTTSLHEFLRMLQKKLKSEIPLDYGATRVGDQPFFVADIRKIKKELNWKPNINFNKGLDTLITWVKENKKTIEKVLA